MGRRRGVPEGQYARGVLLAACSAALSVSAHGMAGGPHGDLALTVLLTTLLAWGGGTLAGRGGFVTLIGVLGTTQAGQHLLFTEIAGTHVHHAAPPVDGWTMFATHAVATVLTAALLRRIGATLGSVHAALAWLAARLRVMVAAPIPARPDVRPDVTPVRPGLLLEILLRRVLARRGPPVRS